MGGHKQLRNIIIRSHFNQSFHLFRNIQIILISSIISLKPHSPRSFLSWHILLILLILILMISSVGLMICVLQPLTPTPLSLTQLKKEVRKVEGRWKKKVHHLHMKDLLISLNQSIKDSRAAYFCNLINCYTRFLFKTINQLLNRISLPIQNLSSYDCETLLSFFVGKTDDLRSNFTNSALTPAFISHRTFMTEFAPLSYKNNLYHGKFL